MATKGPWRAVEDAPGCWTVEPVVQTDGFAGGYRWLSEEDARLIAAAPELLEIVTAFAAAFDEDLFVVGNIEPETVAAAKALLATIKGKEGGA